MSPYIPQRIKRAKQQITVKLYQDRLAMLDQYGRFIEDSRDYIIARRWIWFSRRTEISCSGSNTNPPWIREIVRPPTPEKEGSSFTSVPGTKGEDQTPEKLLP